MRSDFTFVLHCPKCGTNGEIDEYTLRHPCPECGSEMRLSRIRANIHGDALKQRLIDLQAQKARGDRASGRILALLEDSLDPAVRKPIDEVREEKYCREHGIPVESASPLPPQEAETEKKPEKTPRKTATKPKRKPRVTRKPPEKAQSATELTPLRIMLKTIGWVIVANAIVSIIILLLSGVLREFGNYGWIILYYFGAIILGYWLIKQ